MNPHQHDSFRFLQPFWPNLYELGRQAEQYGAPEPDLAAIRLRGFTEAMVPKLFDRLELAFNPSDTHFERLVQLEKVDLLDARLLAKFHTIRRLGNNAAHNRGVTAKQVEGLIEDAWSLACWFCRFMRPDIHWLIPPRDMVDSAVAVSPADDGVDGARQPTAIANSARILKFPEDRIRRIREEVARAMSQVDPRVRQLRTRITLRDAFTERLTDDQSACLDALETFLADREQRIFLLKGYAGTGKTFLARGLTEFLAAQGRAFRLGAPTGRAAKVISEKTGRDARTLHRLIYDFGNLKEYADDDLADGSETFKVYAEIASNQGQANTVYIVDEASLVSDVYAESEFFRSGTGYLLQDFLTYVGFAHGEHDKKIIFIGDPAQLPPVGMSSSPALDADYLREHFGYRPAEYELKEILRQKADSGVIRNVMPLRDSLSKGVFSSLSFDFDEDVGRIRADEVLPVYMAARAGSESGLPIVITHSNAEAAGINRDIRSAIFPGRDFVTSGDRLIVSANAFVGDHMLANGEFVQVAEVESAIERRSVTLRQRNHETGAVESVEVPLIFRDLLLIVATEDGGEALLRVKILDDYLHGSRSGLDAAQQRALYVDFLRRHPGLKRDADPQSFVGILRGDPYFNALRSRFGYAVTCHKAQGGEWEHVIVSCPHGQNPRSADYFRWLYTAMTRSSGKLYLIEPPEIRIKVVGMDWWSGSGQQTNAEPGATLSEGPTTESVSPQETFRHAVLARVRELLTNTGIEIDDVAHHQYQEAFYLRRDAETARANISYNGKFKISAVTTPQSGSLSDQLGSILAPLIGQVVASSTHAAAGACAGPQAVPSRPFLKNLHDRLLPLLDARQIRVTSLKEQAWSQRYTFARGNEAAVIDVFYDGKDRFTKCMPINFGRLNASPGSLLPDVLEILTSEVIP
ncbi:AAA family ATPase [Myxococcus sp. 1LA]